MNRAEWLLLSDERDAWMSRLLSTWRGGFEAGQKAGYAVGLEHGLTHGQVAWDAYCTELAAAPTFEELELLRWGPAGREHFGDPRPGDYPGNGDPW